MAEFYFNPGDLKHRIDILTVGVVGTAYSWATSESTFAKYEQLNGNNIFSSVGIGARSVRFTIRKRNLTLNNAIRWNGKFCFLTNIYELERRYFEVTAALVEPKTCTVKRSVLSTDNALKRLAQKSETTLIFPACLVEKYLGQIQDKPMTITQITYVLVTPKVIELLDGDIVEVDGQKYNIQIVHTLDLYKNEYEITRKVDG